jgi:homoserine O-succinyltransferase
VPLRLPSDHPAGADFPRAGREEAALKVGIINIMPRAEAYEPLLLRRLAAAPDAVEPVFLRLESHAYGSSDGRHIDRFYRSFAAAGPLDGLILTGAPVEEVAFEDVHYWQELKAILGAAGGEIRSTLGVCWGGLALGALLDVPKRLFRRKLFGAFEHRVLAEGDRLLPREGVGSILCAHSRHSGFDDEALDRAAGQGRVRILASSPETGHTIVATPDHRFVAHLGHPEYEADRLVFEWDRDRNAGRPDVGPPHGLDLAQPETTWRKDSEAFFARWLGLLRS